MDIVDVCLAVNQNIVVKRAKFSEITFESVTKSINNLVDIDMKLAQAVDVRKELDLKSGAAFTRLQTLMLNKKFPTSLAGQIISYGSCQFPTLGFVVERYKQINEFISEPFWKINFLHLKNSHNVVFNWQRVKLFDEHQAKTALQNITDGGSIAYVTDVTNKPKSKWRPFAMDTVEMEKLSSRKLKINPKTTMDIAEKLYSQGFISYPRTETNIFPKEMNLTKLVANQVSDTRWGDFARKLLREGITPNNGNKSDKAHPPIYPLKTASGLDGLEASIFELITRHFLACLSKNALAHETKISIDCFSKFDQLSTRSAERFHVSGLTITKKNYLEIYPYDKWVDKEIPLYEKGEMFIPSSVSLEKGNTTPPSLLTDADLITLMDKHGIGTDATHADHIEKVKSREYVITIKEGSTEYLTPGKLGIGLVEGYSLMGIYLAKPDLRSRFEADLKLICDGMKQPREVLDFHLNEYRKMFLETVSRIDKLQEGVGMHIQEPLANISIEEIGLLPIISQNSMDDKTGKKITVNEEASSQPQHSAETLSTNVLCDCQQDAVLRIIRKGPNKGKSFYSCMLSKCSTFVWVKNADLIDSNENLPASQSTASNHLSILCNCGKAAKLLTVRKDNANKGRQFYMCSNQVNNCNFFRWCETIEECQ